jgi:membrane protease YdiL (CAAX protease family)
MQRTYKSQERFFLAIGWSISTIVLSYLILTLSVILFGYDNFVHPPDDIQLQYQLVITIYTAIPAIVALFFIYRFKTAHYLEPGLNFPKNLLWLLFGFFYTGLVLVPTILTSIIFTDINLNFEIKPLANLNFTSGNFVIDIVIYSTIMPLILLFSFGGFIRIIGEEYGWRGYLLPEMIKSRKYLNFVYGILLVGLVWTIYHIPFFTFLSPQILQINEMFFSLLGSFGVFFGATLAMAWAYLKTHNLWPALSLHYLWNIINPQITGNIYSNTQGLFEGTLWLNNGEGLIGGFYHIIIGIIFLYLIIRDKDTLLRNHNKYLKQIKDQYYQNDKIEGKTQSKKPKKPKKQKSNRSESEKYILR